ncbi:hypothetical protein [Schinkia azotoformans]|nr:hypothetical protein [Schinkia azotoformans]MEC1787740.1 hypothetical protein [Schinkia azotoformans]
MRNRAEGLKANLGTGGIKPCWLIEPDNLAKDGDVQYHQWVL